MSTLFLQTALQYSNKINQIHFWTILYVQKALQLLHTATSTHKHTLSLSLSCINRENDVKNNPLLSSWCCLLA